MLHDSYEILGLTPGADKKAIRAAYARAAKTCHPDGPTPNATRFRQVSEAYEYLCSVDPAQVARREANRKAFFEHLSRQNAMDMAQTMPELEMKLEVSLRDLCKGATHRIRLREGTKVQVRIPPGQSPTRKLRLHLPMGRRVSLSLVLPKEDDFALKGRNIHGHLTLPLSRLRKGGKVKASTPAGELEVSIPPLSVAGQVLRLKGKGLPAIGKDKAGHLYLLLVAERAEAFGRMVDHFARSFTRKKKQRLAGDEPDK